MIKELLNEMLSRDEESLKDYFFISYRHGLNFEKVFTAYVASRKEASDGNKIISKSGFDKFCLRLKNNVN